MPEPKRVTVPVRVHPDTRDDWHDYVEKENEWESVSDLIRGSVEREIDGWYSPYGPAGGVNGELTANVDLGPVMDQLETISDDIGNLDRRMSDIEQSKINDPIARLAMEIREMIPLVDDSDIVKNLDPSEAGLPIHEYIGTYGDVEDIILYYTEEDERDVTEMQVRQAIDRLKNDLPGSIEIVTYRDENQKVSKRLCEVR